MESDLNFGNGIVLSWEKGHKPSMESLIKLSKYFDLSGDELLEMFKGNEH